MIKRCGLCLLITCWLVAGADINKPGWKGPDQPVYVVTQNHYAEGFGLEGNKTPRFGDLIAIEIFNPKARTAEHNPAYTVGGRIALFLGGQRRGDVRINRVAPFQCDSSSALVSTDASFRLPKNEMALASNGGNIRPHANSQRAADATEHGYAVRLAMNEFSKHGVPATLAKNIKFDRLVVTKLDDGEATFLIGTASVKDTSGIHNVFFIGQNANSGATSEFARYHKTTDVEEGTDSEYVGFVNQLDLDGDGTDEIVVEVRGYESEQFEIYHRQNGTWSKVHVGGEGGC